MDWDPIPPSSGLSSPEKGWSGALAPQRLFAPQKFSGLEEVFEKSLRVGEGGPEVGKTGRGGTATTRSWWSRFVG